jgi:uncharacterized membrane protein (UPF0127 family)
VSAALVDGHGRVVCEHLSIAASPASRMRGLLGRSSLASEEGLLLRPASSVHTAFMRFAIDVVFLDRDLRVIDVVPELEPWRMSGRRRARVVLELRAGEAARRGLRAGSLLGLAAAAS